MDVAGYSHLLVADTNVECWKGGHMTTGVFAVVALIAYGVGVLCVSIVLVRSRHRLEDPEFKKVFGFCMMGFN